MCQILRALIEPSGIEINTQGALLIAEHQALIEPSGIEISIGTCKARSRNSFNRTFWN